VKSNDITKNRYVEIYGFYLLQALLTIYFYTCLDLITLWLKYRERKTNDIINIWYLFVLTLFILLIGKCVFGKTLEGEGKKHSRELPNDDSVNYKRTQLYEEN